MSNVIKSIEYFDGEGQVEVHYGVLDHKWTSRKGFAHDKPANEKQKLNPFNTEGVHELQIYDNNLGLSGRRVLGLEILDGGVFRSLVTTISSDDRDPYSSYNQEYYPILGNQQLVEQFLDRLNESKLPLEELIVEVEDFLTLESDVGASIYVKR